MGRLIDVADLEKFIQEHRCVIGDDNLLLVAADDGRWQEVLPLVKTAYNVGNNFYGSNPMWYRGGIIKMGKASLPAKRRLIPTSISTFTSIFIFAQKCLRKKTQSLYKEVEAVTVLV